MEESAQRRERLKAMRMEASRQEETTCNDTNEHAAVSLSNPLLESAATNAESQGHSFAQSFNYYTDPMAAYSGNKQKSKVSPQTPQDYSTPQRPKTNATFSSHSFQPRINQSPNPRMQQQGLYPNPNYTHTPPPGGSFPRPSFDHQGRGWNNTSPRPQPHFISSPSHGSGYSSPHSKNNTLGRGYPSPGPTNFRNSPYHGSGQPGYPSPGLNQGRGQWSGNSRNAGPSSGRGKGQHGGHNHVSAEDRPDLFYNKSMVEDPWKFLEPVVWKSHKKTWHAFSAKKPRVSESPRRQQRQSSSQPSLAEILAASFHEATSEEPNVE